MTNYAGTHVFARGRQRAALVGWTGVTKVLLIGTQDSVLDVYQRQHYDEYCAGLIPARSESWITGTSAARGSN